MTDVIKFILNNKQCEISNISPTTTILQYLRKHLKLTGTKEGCAEGDCGACTVVLGEIINDKSHYKTVNACILFIPVLDGKHLITVEHLQTETCELHSVQQAIIDNHGSQCGFCTPGFVMSLYALGHNNDNPTNREIHNALAGNLCRCTGYRPILDAAKNMKKFNILQNSDLKKIQRKTSFEYEADGIKFFSPITIKELCELKSQYPDARILAGGTDIGLWVTKYQIELPVLIYTGNISELKTIKETDSNYEIGTAVSYTNAFDILASYDETYIELFERFSSQQIRNSGTIGGNIANGSPISDAAPCLITLNAKLEIASSKDSRQIPIEDFFIDYGKQDLAPNEILTKIIIPKKTENTIIKSYKLSKRFDQDISAVCAAFSITFKDNKIISARLAYGGMAATPKRAAHAEKALLEQEWNEKAVENSMNELAKDFTPLTDMRASSEYRIITAKNLLYRCFIETTEPKTKTRVYDYAE